MPSRRRFLSGLGTAGAVGLAGCAGLGESQYSPGTDDSTTWPMPAYDRQFTAYNPDAAAPRVDVSERWATEISRPAARPVIAANRVLVPTVRALEAYDLTTGDLQWRYGQEQLWTSAPVVHDGTAYVGFADQRGFVALDVETGDEEWSIETQGSIQAAPTFDHNQTNLYVGDVTGKIYQIDVASGEVTLRGEVFGPVTALAHNNSLLVGTESGEVYDIFPHYGEFTGLWRTKVEGWVTAVAAAPDGGIFVGTFGGPVYHLQDDAEVGSSRWEVDQGAIHLATTGGEVVGCEGGGIRSFDARSGTVEWDQNGAYGAAPAIAGDTIYAAGGEKGQNGQGFIAAYALSGGTNIGPLTVGAKRWEFSVESAVMEGVAIADGAVFAVTQGREEVPPKVYALGPA